MEKIEKVDEIEETEKIETKKAKKTTRAKTRATTKARTTSKSQIDDIYSLNNLEELDNEDSTKDQEYQNIEDDQTTNEKIRDGKIEVVEGKPSEIKIHAENDLTEISGALGVTSYTPNCSEGYVTSKVGTDIKSSLKSGHNILVIQTADNLPSPTNSDTINNNTGMGMVLINIMGYMNFET